MKNIRQYILAGIALLMLTACPSDPEPIPEAQTYTQSVELPPSATEQEVTLNGLNTYIATVEYSSAWLIVKKLSFTGSAKVKLQTTLNMSKDERKCDVIVTSSSGDKVILSVTQQGNPEGIDDLHNSQTDKPAYRRW